MAKTKGKSGTERKSAVLFNNRQLFPWQRPDKSSKSQMHLWPSFWKGFSNLRDWNWTSKMGIKVFGGPSICCSNTLVAEWPPSFFIRLIKNNMKNYNSQISSLKCQCREQSFPNSKAVKKATLNNALFLLHLFLNFYLQIRYIPIGRETMLETAEWFDVTKQIKQRIIYNHHWVPMSIVHLMSLCRRLKGSLDLKWKEKLPCDWRESLRVNVSSFLPPFS